MAKRAGSRDMPADHKVELPYQWAPRPHQRRLWSYLVGGGQRAVAVWHRRAGKDSVGINALVTRSHMEDPGLYYYMAPTQKHARKIIWDNIGSDGRRIMDQAIPRFLRESTNDQEMRIVTKHGSIIQVLGSDNYDSIVGSNPRGIVFSEWAIAERPEAWNYFRPILAENGGWALFIYTPRGFNHGYKTYQHALAQDDWFCEKLTIEDTGILTRAQAEEMAAEDITGMAGGSVAQEFFCEFEADTQKQLFDGAALKGCFDRDPPDYDRGAPIIMGVDVARFGPDCSVFAFRVGKDMRSIPWEHHRKLDSVQVATRALQAIERHKVDACFVDETGMPGVCDYMRHHNPKPGQILIQGIHFNQPSPDPTYGNIRAYMYGTWAKWCREPDTCLPQSALLFEELAALEKDYHKTTGALLATDKDTLKKNMGRSPDDSDAGALTFARPVPRRDVRRHHGGQSQQYAIMD